MGDNHSQKYLKTNNNINIETKLIQTYLSYYINQKYNSTQTN